jgi:DNA-binding NarL/FixJ family response regulator
LIRSAPAADASAVAPTSVLVVARHALVRGGLRAILGSNPGFTVTAEARDDDAALEVARQARPDVILFAHAPPAAIASALKAQHPASCLLTLDSADDDAEAGCLRLAADTGLDELCALLDSALQGRCSGCALRAECQVPRAVVALSPRERQVAVCVAEGLSSKQIAAALGIGLRTVNTYREALARKLGASSAAVVTRYVLEHRITP